MLLNRAEGKILYETCEKYIKVLVERSIFFSKPEYRDAIVPVVTELGFLFVSLAEKLGKNEEAKELMNKFFSVFLVTQQEEKETKDYSNKAFDDIKDEINYLKVSIKNLCGVDLDNDDLDKLEKVAIVERKKDKEILDTVSVFHNILNTSIDVESVENNLGEFLIKSRAHERLNNDITNGDVYIYKTKPKINVYIKYLLCFLCSLGLLCSIGWLFSSLKDLGNQGNDNHEFMAGGKAMFVFMLAASSFYFGSHISSIYKGLKNDNFKYSFQKITVYKILFFSVFFISSYSLVDRLSALAINNNLTQFVFGHTFIAAFFSHALLYLMAYFFLNPKKNQEVIDSTLAKHMAAESAAGDVSIE